MAKKKPKKKPGIERQLSDAWEAFTRGEINRQKLSSSFKHKSDLIEFLDTRYGLEWQVGKRAALRMAEAAQDFREVMLRSGYAQWICDDLCSKGLSENTVAEILFRGFLHGYQDAASDEVGTKRAGSRAGGAVTRNRAEKRRRLIVEAWKETDSSLPDAERYAAVKKTTGIKSTTTILKALRSQ